MWFSCICSLYGGHVHACAYGGQRSAILLLFSTLLFEIGLSVNLELTNLRISRLAHLRGSPVPTSPQEDIAGVWCHTQLPPIAAVEPSSGTSVCVADTSAAEPFPHEAFVAPTKVGRYSSGGQIDRCVMTVRSLHGSVSD